MTDVKTINFKGKQYVMVAERLRQLYDQKHDLEVLDSTFAEIGGRVLCKVTILVDGKRFTGNAEAKLLNAVPKSADETNPLECAETSALGRALAFANFGTVDGIASLDELARSMTPDQINAAVQSVAPRSPSATSAAVAQRPTAESMNIANDVMTSDQLNTIKKLCGLLGKAEPEKVQTLGFLQAKSIIHALTTEFNAVQQRKANNRAQVGAK